MAKFFSSSHQHLSFSLFNFTLNHLFSFIFGKKSKKYSSFSESPDDILIFRTNVIVFAIEITLLSEIYITE